MFEQLYKSAERGELVCLDGGMLRFHLRKDGQLTIYEIVVEPQCRRRGMGVRLLQEAQRRSPQATSFFAKCPARLPANGWYRHIGFRLEGQETTKSGAVLNLWRKLI